MNRTRISRWIVTGALALVALSSGCTMKSQEAPPLTGPSELGTSITVTVTPDVLTQDGGSQSLVTISAFDQNGKPLRNLSLRSEIYSGGVRVDFGSLSARNLVTDSNGRATLVYTAPSSPGGLAVDSGATVQIAVTPIGTDFANEMPRFATIRLIPTGGVVPPDGLQPKFTFTPTTPTDHQVVLFDASTSVSPATNPITGFAWNFGDGSRGSGMTTTHSYNTPGTYVVTMTVSDAFNRTATTSQTLSVGGGTIPTAAFVVSPSTSPVGQNVNFNASGSRPAPGRTIGSYTWDFGDGTPTVTTTTPITSHPYDRSGNYTVTLVVTDDAGRFATATSSVTITATSALTANFSVSPTSSTSGTPVNFSAVAWNAIEGRTIVGFAWSVGDGTSSTAATPTNAFGTTGTFDVTLTDTRKSGRVTKTVTVA